MDEESKYQVVEVESVELVNQLYLSGEFRQPEFSESRNCYILTRKVKK